MRSQWFQPRSVSDRRRQHGGDKDSAAQGLAQCLYPRDLVDRGADDRKVEAGCTGLSGNGRMGAERMIARNSNKMSERSS